MPLKMDVETKTIVDGLLVDPDETNIDIDDTYLSYYVDLLFDEDISDADICKGISRLKKEDVLLDIEVECEDEEGVDFDIYRTRISDVEKC